MKAEYFLLRLGTRQEMFSLNTPFQHHTRKPTQYSRQEKERKGRKIRKKEMLRGKNVFWFLVVFFFLELLDSGAMILKIVLFNGELFSHSTLASPT